MFNNVLGFFRLIMSFFLDSPTRGNRSTSIIENPKKNNHLKPDARTFDGFVSPLIESPKPGEQQGTINLDSKSQPRSGVPVEELVTPHSVPSDSPCVPQDTEVVHQDLLVPQTEKPVEILATESPVELESPLESTPKESPESIETPALDLPELAEKPVEAIPTIQPVESLLPFLADVPLPTINESSDIFPFNELGSESERGFKEVGQESDRESNVTFTTRIMRSKSGFQSIQSSDMVTERDTNSQIWSDGEVSDADLLGDSAFIRELGGVDTREEVEANLPPKDPPLETEIPSLETEVPSLETGIPPLERSSSPLKVVRETESERTEYFKEQVKPVSFLKPVGMFGSNFQSLKDKYPELMGRDVSLTEEAFSQKLLQKKKNSHQKN
jgi:hypothetical protein